MFIKVTNSGVLSWTKDNCRLNLLHIAEINESERGCRVIMSNGNTTHVDETLDEISKRISSALDTMAYGEGNMGMHTP